MAKITYKEVYFEISGICNARCPFCITGTGRLPQGGLINVDLFKKSIDKLIEEKLIDNRSSVFLYNWGEPFLHQDLDKIIEYVNKREINFALSSNASVYKEFKAKAVKKLQEISFSMSGFSQSSYDRVHGFRFEKIKKNIAKFAENLKKVGYRNKVKIFFHIYQFNLDEIILAKEFAKNIGADFVPYYAFIADYEKAKNYLLNKLSIAEMRSVAESIVLADMVQKIKMMPANYRCPQYDILVLDEKADILTCCFLPKDHPDYYCGNLFDDKLRESLKAKTRKNECKFCLESGLSHCVHNVTIPEFSNLLR
ncbi:MAG: radical SAM protein [Pseudomonadota bacterium]|nr:radical SAM protein [Pseudomonadota bacterium]